MPVVIDSDNVIVCGHTRYKAAQQLGLDCVPCVIAELATWDFELLKEELSGVTSDLREFGFDDLLITNTRALTCANSKLPRISLLPKKLSVARRILTLKNIPTILPTCRI